MTWSVCHITVHPARHVVHADTARRAQIIARLLAERFPGMAFSMTRSVDLGGVTSGLEIHLALTS